MKVPVSANGQATVVDPKYPAALSVAFFGAKGDGRANYIVLDTGMDRFVPFFCDFFLLIEIFQDYDTYTLIYTCYVGETLLSKSTKTEYGDYAQCSNFHFNFLYTSFFLAWILSRERTLDAAIVARLDEKLVELGVDMSKILITDQSDC